MNIRRLGDLKNDVMIDRDNILFFANNYYERLRWNGRQIRNAFQTAFALAEYQATFCENPSGVRTILNANHFEAVANAAMAFDGYLTDIYGGHDDSDRAKHDQIRVDHWRGAQAGVGQAAQSWGPTAAPNWGSGAGQSWGSSTGGPWPAQGGGPGPTQFWPSHTTPASAQQVPQTALNPTPTQFAQNPPKPWTPAPYPTQILDINPVQASDNSRILGLNPLSGAGGPAFGQGTSNANPATAGTEQDNSRNEYSDEDF